MLGNYSRIGYEFKNRLNIFAVMKVKFNLRQTSDENKDTLIYLVCTINHKQEKISTGQKVRPKYWDKERQVAIVANTLPKAIQQQNTKVNKELNILSMRFSEWQDYMLDHPEEIEFGAEKLRVFVAGEREKLKVNPLDWFESAIQGNSNNSAGTKGKYMTDLKMLRKFVEESKVRATDFSCLNYTFIKKFEKYMLDKGMSMHTIINRITSFKSWLNDAEKQGLINQVETGISKYEKPRNKDEGKQIYLTENELKKIQNIELSGNEERARDIFVLQCQLGQRYADIMNLDNAIISDDNIELVQIKTHKKVIIPLNNIAKNILAKYNNKLPFIRNEYMNQLIKEICRKAGIDKEELITYRKGDKQYEEKVQRWQLVGTHTARRTFVTECRKQGLDDASIMRITGHTSTKTMSGYDKRTGADVAKRYAEIMSTENEKKVRKKNEKKQQAIKTIENLALSGVRDVEVAAYSVQKALDLSDDDVSFSIDNGVGTGLIYQRTAVKKEISLDNEEE